MPGDGVLLDRSDLWHTIPPAIQHRIEEGEQRIRVIREAVACEARVHQMPPVTIDPAVWIPPQRGIIHAASGIWRSNQGGHAFGVIAAAGVALSYDPAVVRAILVHEFAHCFLVATRIIDHLDLRTPLNLDGESMDKSREDALLPQPADWFPRGDIPLLRWDDSRLGALSDELVTLAEAGHLPVTGPPLTERGFVAVPPEWGAHIRLLRRQRP
ncbi:MAG TPA: hypothetical protein VL332_04715 [Candidatus Saccharimonadaceae bacterium]|jgi:hypothetical protein|nr:hypothetical protein [Candidatus Saccharimonadaceae bacterium]